MKGEMQEAILAKTQAVAEEREIIAQANATPLPGALRDAFAAQQDIKVGKYSVRPFYDMDFEILQMLDHPLAKMALGGEKYGERIQDLRGINSWTVCFMLTHDVDEVDELSQKGAEAFQRAARKEFGRLQLGGLLEINKAILEQFGRYFSTVVGLEAVDNGDGAPKKA